MNHDRASRGISPRSPCKSGIRELRDVDRSARGNLVFVRRQSYNSAREASQTMIRQFATILTVSGLVVACVEKAPDRAAVSVAGESDSGGRPNGALSLVREYVQRDSRGERLGPSPWFTTVVTWPDDPGYDSYTAITGFELTPHSTGLNDSAQVRVTYHTAGWILAGDSTQVRFMPHDSLETQIFSVIRAGGLWRIASPQIGQHVLVEAALTASSLGSEDRKKLLATRGRAAAPTPSGELRELAWRQVNDASPAPDSLRRALADTGRFSKVEAFGIAELGGQSMLFAKYTTGSGTGWHQAEYRVIANGRVVWRALAEESWANFRAAPLPQPSYHVQSCLLAGPDSVLGYLIFSSGSMGRGAVREDTTTRPGLYGWSKATTTFRYLGALGDHFKTRCRVR